MLSQGHGDILFHLTATNAGWWAFKGTARAEALRKMMIEHQDIIFDWQFSDKQKEKLQQYYQVNKFLVEYLNMKNIEVSDSVRKEIKKTLLLPTASQEESNGQ